MLAPAISCFENSVDPDQLASKRIHTIFHSGCNHKLMTGLMHVNWIKLGGSVVNKISCMLRVNCFGLTKHRCALFILAYDFNFQTGKLINDPAQFMQINCDLNFSQFKFTN